MRGNYKEPFWQIYRNLSGNRVRGRWTHTYYYYYSDDYREYCDDYHMIHMIDMLIMVKISRMITMITLMITIMMTMNAVMIKIITKG